MKYLPLLLLCLAGCITRPPGPPAPKPSTDADYFEAFADNLPEHSDELLWCVRRLHDGGKITDAEQAEFDRAFADVKDKDRELTDADKSTLRGLK